jgi:hypothetical protein
MENIDKKEEGKKEEKENTEKNPLQLNNFDLFKKEINNMKTVFESLKKDIKNNQKSILSFENTLTKRAAVADIEEEEEEEESENEKEEENWKKKSSFVNNNTFNEIYNFFIVMLFTICVIFVLVAFTPVFDKIICTVKGFSMEP